MHQTRSIDMLGVTELGRSQPYRDSEADVSDQSEAAPELSERRWVIFGERMSAQDVECIFGTPKARFLRRIDQGIEPERAALNERVYGHRVSRHKVRSGHRIFRLRKARGLHSPDDLAAKADLSPERILDYEYGMSPWSDKRCDWKICAKRLAEGLGMFPEEVWPKVARRKLPRTVQADRHCDPEAFSMDEIIDAKQVLEALFKCLKFLQPKERWVIDKRYGFSDGSPPNGGFRGFQEIGSEVGRCRERIRQLELSALRRCRRVLSHAYGGRVWNDIASTVRLPTDMQLGMTHLAWDDMSDDMDDGDGEDHE